MSVPLLATALLLGLACAGPQEPSDPPRPGPAPGAVEPDAERAWRHLVAQVAFGPRPSGSQANERTRGYLEEQLTGMGLEPRRETFEAATPAGTISFANVVADLEARRPDAPIVVLAAHFDTKRLPFEFVGANDGGSGTAVLLELARVLVSGGPRPVTYRFLFLDGEEALRSYWAGEDNCYGSRHHVRQLRRTGELARVGALVLLDMVGDRDLRLTDEGYSTDQLVDVFFEAARSIGLGAHVGARARDIRDDHLPFLDAGVPSVNLIDFEYGVLNEHWHERTDTLERCSKESLLATARIVLAGLPAVERFVRAPASPGPPGPAGDRDG